MSDLHKALSHFRNERIIGEVFINDVISNIRINYSPNEMIIENLQEILNPIRYVKKENESWKLDLQIQTKSNNYELNSDFIELFVFRLLDPRFVVENISGDFSLHPFDKDRKFMPLIMKGNLNLLNLPSPIAKFFREIDFTTTDINFYIDDDLIYYMEQSDFPPFDDERIRVVFFYAK